MLCLVTQSCPTLCSPWTVALHSSLSMGFCRQEYGIDCHSLLHGLLPTQELNQRMPQADSLPSKPPDTIELISHASKVMLKILQPRLQQYVNSELPDVQAGFRKSRGTRYQISNICWIMEKAREFQKNIYFCFLDYAKAFDCVDHNKLWKILKEM